MEKMDVALILGIAALILNAVTAIITGNKF